jgi:ubiquinone/menaquinone biosynthesis C-methylase UbiE
MINKLLLKLNNFIARTILNNNFVRAVFVSSVISDEKLFKLTLNDLFQHKNITQVERMVGRTNIGTKNLSNREDWLKNVLIKIPRGKRILDAGAGELQYKKFCSHLEYTSQDFGQYNGKGNDIALQTKTWDNSKLDIVSDITNIPVNDETFDAIMCVEVFEHLLEPANAVREFSRIIKKGGTLIITAPFCSLTHFAPYYYANGYSRFWYEKILGGCGFEIKEIVPNGNYFEYLAQEIQRISDVSGNNLEKNIDRKEELAKMYLLKKLANYSDKDSDSKELLNFGYHVKAIKK